MSHSTDHSHSKAFQAVGNIIAAEPTTNKYAWQDLRKGKALFCCT